MNPHFATSVALRQLRHNLGQTLLSMGVVAISVSLIVFISSLIGGLQKRLINSVTGAIPHVIIKQPQRLPIAAWETQPAPAPAASQPREPLFVGERIKLEQRKRKIEDWNSWLDRLASFDPRVTAVSPVVEGQGFLSRGAQRRAVTVAGVIPERHNNIVDIESKLNKGRFFGLNAGEVAIGWKIADEFSLNVGDKIRLVSSDNIAGTYTIAGIFETGFFQVDTATVYVPLRDAQTLFGLGTAITSIGLKLSDIYSSDEIADRLAAQVPYEASSWMRDYGSLLTGLKAQSATSGLILAFTTIAAGFGIASIMIMSVVSKLKEIGILKAIGATRRQILVVFTLQGTLLAFLGAILGAGFGIGMALGFSTVEVVVGVTGKPVQMFPLGLSPEKILLAFGIAITTGFLASLYPAWRAARVDPIEVIRGI